MKKCVFILVIFLPLIALSQRSLRIAQLQNQLKIALDTLYSQTLVPTNNIECNYLTNGALAEAVINGNYSRAEAYFHKVFDMQDTVSTSPTYGLLKWAILDPGILDSNAIEFGTEAIAPLYYQCGDSLSAAFKAYMLPHLEASITELVRNVVDVSYTNIYLKKTVNTFLISQLLRDSSAGKYAKNLVNNWINYTNAYGIAEYDAPTYYNEDLTPLNYATIFITDTNYSVKFPPWLERYWQDISANYFPSANNSISGPHSRDYNFLDGGGAVNTNCYIEGLDTDTNTITNPAIERIHVLVSAKAAGGYIPPASILNLSQIPARVVLSTSDSSSASCRYNYVTTNFAIGSTSQNYAQAFFDDKLINVIFNNKKKFPDICIVPDTFNSPYGSIETAFGNESKPSHQALFPACVQDKGNLLVSLAMQPDFPNKVSSFATNILIPKDADTIICNGQLISTSALFQKAIPSNSTIGTKAGQAAVVFRILEIDSLDGKAAGCYLQMDSTGMANGALRFTAYHYNGVPVSMKQNLLKFSVFITAANCINPGDFSTLLNQVGAMTFKLSGNSSTSTISTIFNTDTLLLSRNTSSSARAPISRTVNGKEMPCAIFQVDTVSETIPTGIASAVSTPVPTPSFSLFPNPNNGSFTLENKNFESGSVYVVEVYNTLGKLIARFTGSQNTLPITLPHPAQGLYYYRVSGKDGTIRGREKFIID